MRRRTQIGVMIEVNERNQNETLGLEEEAVKIV